MLKNYNHQFIIYFDDGQSVLNADGLRARAAVEDALHQTDIIPLAEPRHSATFDLAGYKNKVTNSERVYVIGHGSATSATVARINAEDWAETLRTLAGGKKIKRVTFVACHSGKLIPANGDIAPHRFVVDFFKHAQDFVIEAAGYTGEVNTDNVEYTITGTARPPADARRYRPINGGAEVWVGKGQGKKTIGHEYPETGNRRKIFVRAGVSGGHAKGWTSDKL